MEVYLLGSVIAFGLTIVVIFIQESLLLSLSRVERLHYECTGGEFGGHVTLKEAFVNTVLSWVGIVVILLSFMMLLICLFAIKR
ncbi:MAG: hypothetical protein KAH72_03380 [Flavobacteriaceae bacterium]|nr:hypothetical protein [Flavobacteriaceae bacterium]